MKITVVGDVLLDEDVEGTVTRLCPDAPVPVVEVTSRRTRAGGAGLVATMLQLDGHDVELVTALSHDDTAGTLREQLSGVRIVACDSGLPTPAKRRLRTPDQSVCRIDEGCAETAVPEVTPVMLAAIAQADVLIVADYGRGLTASEPLRAALEERAAQVPLVWDPHPKGADPVRSSWVITPNLGEAARAAGTRSVPEAAEDAAAVLQEQYGCAAVLVTLGDDGALLRDSAGSTTRIDAAAVVDADPCGAGDRLAATLAVELGGGTSLVDSARSAVTAAGEYLRAGGVSALGPLAPVAPHTPAAAHTPAAPHTPVAPTEPAADELSFELAERVRAQGGTVVAAGGCFDLLHAGHVRTLEAARALGDCLIVCLNSDDSVRRLKGPERPIIREEDRAEMLRALSCVDAVLIFSEDGPERVLERLRPQYWVKGGDYTPESLPEAELIKQWGGSAIMLPFHLRRSTTNLAAALERVS